ncbi:MAG: ACP S-malonyltransferase [Coriobacteriaceae bacterium]|nr:ACP S-malonyltransferase [Coriobacteriaceae bacterium]
MTKTAFLCSGQGCQTVGMGADLLQSSPLAADLFAIAEAVTELPITDLCLDGPLEELSRSKNVQPCLAAFSLSIAEILIDRGVTPDCVAGFSLGEYPAHVIAGTIDEPTMFSLLAHRGELMGLAAREHPGKMAALLRCTLVDAEALCEKHGVATGRVLEPANLNCPGQVVISGEADALDDACADWTASGGRCSVLATEGAFHTPLMRSAADGMRSALEATDFSAPMIPLYCNVDARPLAAGADVADILTRQIISPVRWEDTIRNMIDDGVDTFIECGPGKVLSGMVKRTAREIDAEVTIKAAENMHEIEEIAHA